MYRLLAAVGSLAILSGSAFAADVTAPSNDWTGFYIGGNVNWNFLWTGITTPAQNTQLAGYFPAYDYDNQSGNGFGGGLQAGYDYQINNLVLGIQVSGVITDVNSDKDFGGEVLGTSLNDYGTLTGRVGYLLRPDFLTYVKGGAAGGSFDYTDNNSVDDFKGDGSEWRTGWTVGGGIEYKLAQNWSAFAEYNYVDFGKQTTKLSYSGPGAFWGDTYKIDYDQNFSSVTLGVNYRF